MRKVDALSQVEVDKLLKVWSTFQDEFLDPLNLSEDNNEKAWKYLLNEVGVKHAHMRHMIIIDNEKWFLAKIKYGF